MTNYNHLTIEELNNAIATAEGYLVEQEAKIAGYAKDMGKKKNTLSDYKHLNRMIAYALGRHDEYSSWIADYTEAKKRAERVAEGHEGILEFLEHMLEADVKWHENLKADFNEKGYDAYVKYCRNNQITKVELMFAEMSAPEALKVFKKDLDIRYKKLVLAVEKKVGKVIKIDVDRNWNNGFDGVVLGENGVCSLTTIMAGGYNIQRLHYRTLCK